MTFIMLFITYFFTAVVIVFLGFCLYVFVDEGVPSISRAIENHYRERGEVDFWLMVAVVHHDIPEKDRDRQIQRFVKWSDRRWGKFKSEYQKQTVLTELLPDIEMLRALK